MIDLAGATRSYFESWKREPVRFGAAGLFAAALCGVSGGALIGVALGGLFGLEKPLADEASPLTGSLGHGFTRFVDRFIAGLLCLSGAVVCGVGIIGTLFFFLYAPALIEVEALDWRAACARSATLARSNLPLTFALLGTLVAINLVGALPLGLGLVVSGPLSAQLLLHYTLQVAKEAP